MNANKENEAAVYRKCRLPILGAFLGGLTGFLLLHPYVMLLASTGVIPWHSSAAPVHWSLVSILALERSMMPMAVPFALFGAGFGVLAGSYLNRAHRVQQLLLEQEKNATTLETVKAFTATLSHYLLNANMIIGGKVRHCIRLAPGQEVLESLQVIEDQGRVIDAVVGALCEAAKITVLRESLGQVPMIDLVRELEDRLRQVGGTVPRVEQSKP